MPPVCPSHACPQRKQCFHSRLSGTYFPEASSSDNRFVLSSDPARQRCIDFTTPFKGKQASLEERIMRLVLHFAGLRANPRLNDLWSSSRITEEMQRSFLSAMDMEEEQSKMADDLTDWLRGCLVHTPNADHAITNNLLGVVSILDHHNGDRDVYADRLVAVFDNPRPALAIVA